MTVTQRFLKHELHQMRYRRQGFRQSQRAGQKVIRCHAMHGIQVNDEISPSSGYIRIHAFSKWRKRLRIDPMLRKSDQHISVAIQYLRIDFFEPIFNNEIAGKIPLR